MAIKKWYSVQTAAGAEEKVKYILEQIKLTDAVLAEKIGQVLVPTHVEVVVKNGHREEKTVHSFPGYVLVELDMDDNLWHLVKTLPNVAKFVGPSNKPSRLADRDVQKLLNMTIERPKYRTNIATGDDVKVVSGPFLDFIGKVVEIHPDRGRLKVLLTIFGRETPVELEFGQAEKVIS